MNDAVFKIIRAGVLALMAAGFSVVVACALLGMSRATFYRHMRPVVRPAPRVGVRGGVQPAALSTDEAAAIVADLARPEFADLSVGQVHARVWDEGVYRASLRTYYRVAARERLSGDRRRRAVLPPRVVPHLRAEGPNEVWSWDITAFNDVTRARYHYGYAVKDVFSRKIVGAGVHDVQRGSLAAGLMAECVAGEGGQVPRVIHSDNGGPMKSPEVAAFAAGAGVELSFSRPGVSNDNPYIESFFGTVKGDLSFPVRFDGPAHARAWVSEFVDRYNREHRHSRIGWYTPDSVHDGSWRQVRDRRQVAMDAYALAHPGRHRRPPRAPEPPSVAYINPDPTGRVSQQR